MSEHTGEGLVQAEFARLGIKLNVIQWPLDTGMVSAVLQNMKYRVTDTRDHGLRAEFPGGEFTMDRVSQTLRFSGPPINTLVTVQESFSSMIEQYTGVSLKEYAEFYSSEYVLIYRANKRLGDALGPLYRDSAHMESIRDIVGKNVRPYSIDVTGEGEIGDKTWFRIRAEPKAEGTNRMYYCSADYRDASLDNVVGDAKKAPEVVKKLLRMLEKQASLE